MSTLGWLTMVFGIVSSRSLGCVDPIIGNMRISNVALLDVCRFDSHACSVPGEASGQSYQSAYDMASEGIDSIPKPFMKTHKRAAILLLECAFVERWGVPTTTLPRLCKV